jgi:excisionase family DNA binding protein
VTAWIRNKQLPATKVNGKGDRHFEYRIKQTNLEPPDPEFTLTIREAAEKIGVAPYTISYWVKCKKLPAKKVGKMWMLNESDLQKFMQTDEATVAAAITLERDRTPINLFNLPPAAESANPNPAADRADVEFLVGEMRRKVGYVESDNRRLMDQNLRLRSVIRDTAEMFRRAMEGQAPTYSEAKRFLGVMEGAVQYEGRDEGPVDYKPRELGGDQRRLLEHPSLDPENVTIPTSQAEDKAPVSPAQRAAITIKNFLH